MNPSASDLRVFVPSSDFELSVSFYCALGWSTNWKQHGLAELQLADRRMLLQDFFVKEWAHNFMIHITVESAADWHEHASEVISSGAWGDARCQAPRQEPYGALVAHVWDPCGVLLHFAQPIQDS